MKRHAKKTRLERALFVRDKLLTWLPENSEPLTLTGTGNVSIRTRKAVLDEFEILFRTPFDGPMPKPKFESYEDARLYQGKEALQYGIDVWASRDGRSLKVMNLEYDYSGKVALVAFAPGEWDSELVALIASARRRKLGEQLCS